MQSSPSVDVCAGCGKSLRDFREAEHAKVCIRCNRLFCVACNPGATSAGGLRVIPVILECRFCRAAAERQKAERIVPHADVAKERKIVGQSAFLYWWPVWLIGLLLFVPAVLSPSISPREYLPTMFFPAALCVAWFIAVFVGNRRRYLAIGNGYVRVRRSAGVDEEIWPMDGLNVEKGYESYYYPRMLGRLRWFRAEILGFGAGTLVVRQPGPNGNSFHLYNVIFVERKVVAIRRRIERSLAAARNK
jgi:hypothetical protein